jgi:molybdopterin molybdotransferase
MPGQSNASPLSSWKMSSKAQRILSFEEARRCVEGHCAKILTETTRDICLIDLLSSVGRVLAEPVLADRDFPPFRRAARDGYAVQAADLRKIPVRLQVVGEVKAGSESTIVVGPGQAASIMTGAAAPPGSDGVVMIEYTTLRGSQVEVRKSIFAGDNFVAAGSEARRNDRLLAPGTKIDHAAIALIASVGMGSVNVFRKPRVAILATGDEIVDIASDPGPVQIRNSNTYSLAAQVSSAGAEPVLLPIAPDDAKRLRELIEVGFESDLLLLSGGVSMGKYDLVEQVLYEMQAELFFTGAQIQPGRPVVFGRVSRALDYKYFFGLPGNPVSTMVTFDLFAKPMIEALMGMSERKLVFLAARLKSEITTRLGLKRFLPGIISGEFERAEVELAPWRGSGDIAAVARANCYIVVPPDRERIAAGEWISVMAR